MRKQFTAALLAIMAVCAMVAPVHAKSMPGYSKAALSFGDYTNARPAPTSGTLTGVYLTAGDWTQTGPITCNGCRMKFGGKVTFNDAVTLTAGVEGNRGGGDCYQISGSDVWLKKSGAGPGGGMGAHAVAGPVLRRPSGGGHGGAGGDGSMSGSGGVAYGLDLFLPGSGGGGIGAHGGGGLYVEAIGDVTFTSTAVVHADGVAGTGTGDFAGTGGSGGGIDVRSLGNISVNSGAVITANGANGGVGGGGGGGIVSMMPGPGKSGTNSGTVTVAGGTGLNAGASGVIAIPATFTGPRFSY